MKQGHNSAFQTPGLLWVQQVAIRRCFKQLRLWDRVMSSCGQALFLPDEGTGNKTIMRSVCPSYITPCQRWLRGGLITNSRWYCTLTTVSLLIWEPWLNNCQLGCLETQVRQYMYLHERVRGGENEGTDNSFVDNLSLAYSMLLSHAAAARCNMSQDYAHPNTSLRVHVPEIANGTSQRDFYPCCHLFVSWYRAHDNEHNSASRRNILGLQKPRTMDFCEPVA